MNQRTLINDYDTQTDKTARALQAKDAIDQGPVGLHLVVAITFQPESLSADFLNRGADSATSVAKIIQSKMETDLTKQVKSNLFSYVAGRTSDNAALQRVAAFVANQQGQFDALKSQLSAVDSTPTNAPVAGAPRTPASIPAAPTPVSESY